MLAHNRQKKAPHGESMRGKNQKLIFVENLYKERLTMKLIKQHNYSIKSTTYDKTHEKPQNFGIFRLTAKTKYNYIKCAFDKAIKNGLANSFNHLSVAHSTPISYACFFMRSVYAHPKIDLFSDRLFPMVTRSGKGLNLCRLPLITDLRPVTCYRPKSRKVLAVTLENLISGVTQMYQFIFALMRTPQKCLKIRILADNEHQARARFNHGNALLFVGRINLHRQNTRQNHRTFAEKGGVYA